MMFDINSLELVEEEKLSFYQDNMRIRFATSFPIFGRTLAPLEQVLQFLSIQTNLPN